MEPNFCLCAEQDGFVSPQPELLQNMVRKLTPLKTLSEVNSLEETGGLYESSIRNFLLTLAVEALVVEIPIKLASRVRE